jgi:hypothetical protein
MKKQEILTEMLDIETDPFEVERAYSKHGPTH